MQATDEDLIFRITKRDATALDAFYLRHETPLYHFLRVFTGDEAMATELVNEAMFTVWQKADRFEGRSKPKTWLYTIARNRALDKLRARKPERYEELQDDKPDPDAEAPEERIAAAQDAGKIRTCLSRIRAAHREILQLAFFSEMSQAEIAGTVGCPEGTVKSRMFHAKRAMRHCLETIAGYAR